jgi:hypothetical protein
MESPSIEQLRHLLAVAQAENRPDEEARLMRMIEARHAEDQSRRSGDVGNKSSVTPQQQQAAAQRPAQQPAKRKG